MKILLSWLQEYTPVGDDAEAIADALTRIGLEVDNVMHLGRSVPGVVTATVVRLERHPDATSVQRVWVDAGDGREQHVWCGAFNMAEGDVVPLATLGTTMPDGRTIERRGILGIDSEGMLCSAAELSIGDDDSGIAILPADAPLGVPYGDVIGMVPDAVFDIEVTRNRPDCWGYLGVARDLAAELEVPFWAPAPTLNASARTTVDDMIAPVEIVHGDRCGRFTSTIISGVAIGPAAPWMTRRLTAAGMRPINNVVDVSNYVMLELNQPNHAYDLARLGDDPGFRIRTAHPGERMTTLDEMDRALDAADLLICDRADRPIGIAGIMGGASTVIGDDTTDVLLEVAWFEPTGIGQSVTRLGLRSDASVRNERGVDPYSIDTAIARFVELLAETSPDVRVHHVVDARGESLPSLERSTTVRVTEVNRILGTSLSAGDLPRLLDPIGYTVSGDRHTPTVALPSWRPDSAEEIDVVEEVARRYGYEHLDKLVPRPAEHGHLSPVQVRRRLLRQVLLGLGFSEAMPNPFLAPDSLERAGLSPEAVRVTNPLVTDESVLRTSLRPGLLKAIAYNESHRRQGVKLFEIGRVFPPGDGELPDEHEALGVVIAGAEAPAAMELWGELSTVMGWGAHVDQAQAPPGLHPTRSAALVAGPQYVGAVGEVALDVLRAFD
ncbi:MAG: phenylalanine--tRNA ligase subunit beta, partial [Actinomycetota bacterium]|nr:phenylalanine--tRNA ligase subunit beta [Actinomycetota bacterium]